jgi:hypothetical protein
MLIVLNHEWTYIDTNIFPFSQFYPLTNPANIYPVFFIPPFKVGYLSFISGVVIFQVFSLFFTQSYPSIKHWPDARYLIAEVVTQIFSLLFPVGQIHLMLE